MIKKRIGTPLYYVMCVLFFTVLGIRFFQLRIPQMIADLGDDEMRYIYYILESQQIKDFSFFYAIQMIPHLEYIVRKMFWFPLLGNHERSFRIPSLIYATIEFVFTLGTIHYYFATRKMNRWIRLFFLFIIGCFLSESFLNASYIGEGRHYSFVTLGSTVWFSIFLFQKIANRSRFHIVSAFFLNTHFFSTPVVLAGYVFETFKKLRHSKFLEAMKLILAFAAILAITLYISWDSFLVLLSTSPTTEFSLKRALLGGWELWDQFNKSFNSLIDLKLGIFVILLSAWVTKFRDTTLNRLIYLWLFVLPGVYFCVRIGSTRDFNLRYHAPFWGLSIWLLALFLEYGLELTRRFFSLSIGTVVYCAALFFFYSPQQFVINTLVDMKKPYPRIPSEFTKFQKIYSEIKSYELPTLVIHNHCYSEAYPLFYLKHARPLHTSGYEVVDSLGCQRPNSVQKKAVENFLNKYPTKNLVVLDQKFSLCSDKPQKVTFSNFSATRLKTDNSCVWLLFNLASKKQIDLAMKQLEIRYKDEFLN